MRGSSPRMTEAMFGELMAVTSMANETNRLANGYRVAVDPAFEADAIAQVRQAVTKCKKMRDRGRTRHD
jgi:hypothetical protein